MPFDEPLKLAVRRKAQFQRCLCKDVYVEVHHIVPESDGGPSTEDNAAPLCPTCHERYGANPTKRKFIREARDLWYEICAERYKGVDTAELAKINQRLSEAATKADLEAAFNAVAQMVKAHIAPPDISFSRAREAVAHVTASVVQSMSSLPVVYTGSIFTITGSQPLPPGGSIAETKTRVP